MYIDCESIYSSTSAVKQTSETLRKTINPVPYYISVAFIHICHHCLKMSSFSLEKNNFRSIDLTCWRTTNTAFTILNCLEYEFLKGFLVQGWQQSFWKFSILSNILDLQCCLPKRRQLSTMFSCRDGKGCKLSSQASKMLHKLPGAERHTRNRSTNQIAGNSLFSSEIILSGRLSCINSLTSPTVLLWPIHHHSHKYLYQLSSTCEQKPIVKKQHIY